MTSAHFHSCILEAERTGMTNFALALRQLAAAHFSTVTGRDFGRSIAWAKAQPPGALSNEALRSHVREHKQRVASNPQLSALPASVSRSENRGQAPGRQQPATVSSQPLP